MRWPGELPAGVVDYAAEVRSHGDVFMAHADPEAARLRCSAAAGAGTPHADLLSGFAPLTTTACGCWSGPATAWSRPWRTSLGAWNSDGSVVLVHPDVEVTEQAAATTNASSGH